LQDPANVEELSAFLVAEQPLRNSVVVLTVSGALDDASAPVLRAAIADAAARHPPPARIVVDLAGVPIVNAVGVATLVVGHRICLEMGVGLAVRRPRPAVERMLGACCVRRRRRRRVIRNGYR
jgi:anti-anti-sigma factor